MNKEQWIKYFPYKEPRKEQEIAIDFILNAFLDKKKRYAVLGAPTGCGKSGIAITVARYLADNYQATAPYNNGAYILTTQKILQEQYMRDFSEPHGCLKNIKSSENYSCSYYKQQTCAESRRMLKFAQKSSTFFSACINDCVYKQAKAEFLDSLESITNYSYFLSETVYAGKIKPRNLMICDETHNLSDEISKFAEISFSEFFANSIGMIMPDIKSDAQAMKWIKNEYKPTLIKYAEGLKAIVNDELTRKKIDESELKKLAKKFEKIDKHICKINRFLDDYDKDNWVLDISVTKEKTTRRLEFKPVDVAVDAKELLLNFSEFFVMMSATVLDKAIFCKQLGIDENEIDYLSLESPFPLENRPIFYAPAGSMTYQNIDATLPKLVEVIKVLLEHHKKDKGLIHCSSYRVANYIRYNLNNKRLLFHEQESFSRHSVLEEHLSSKEPTVLVTPSMTEGIDLYDDLSRFQILAKIPYPSLASKIVRKKIKRWNWWYPGTTVKTMIQAIGRSVRSETDYCSTYILDENFDYFYKKHREMFPEWFHKVLIH